MTGETVNKTPLGKKPAETLWNANYCRVMITNFTLYFSFYLLTPLLPIYLSETFHATKDMIGLVLSGYTLVALLIRPFSGFLVDSFPRKTVLMICVAVYFALFSGYLAAGSIILFAVVRTIHGGPYGASTVANSTMAIDVLPSSRRNEGIGYYGLSNNFASALAPTVGIMVYKYTHNFELLFWIAFAIAGMGLVSSYYVKSSKVPSSRVPSSRVPSSRVPSSKFQDSKSSKGARVVSLDRFFMLRAWYLALNMCLYGFCWGVMSNYLAIYSKETMGMTGGTGLYFFILSAGLIVSRLWGAKGLKEGRLKQNAAEGVLLSCIGYTLFVVCPNMVGYYLSAVFIGLGNGHIWPAFQNIIISIAHHNERGTANSTILTSWDLGLGLGILLGGSIAEHFGYASTFWTMAATMLLGALTFFLITIKKVE